MFFFKVPSRVTMTCRRWLSVQTVVFFCVLVPSAGTLAADFPSRPVRLVVPYAPGGSADVLAKQLAIRLSPRLGQPVILDHKPGAGGAVGTQAVINAEPDGHTVLLHTGSVVIDPLLRAKPSYDVRKDLAPVALVTTAGLTIAVNPGLPVKNVAELVTYAAQNPGKLNFSSPGTGSSIHLSTEAFDAAAGIQMTHVPYKGGAPAMNALIANEVQVYFGPTVTVKPQALGGRIRAIAVTTRERSALWPELPTVSETKGIDYEYGLWYAVLAPARTPLAVRNRLQKELAAVVDEPEMRAWMTQNGFEHIARGSPDDLAALLDREVETWGTLIRRLKITAE